MTYEEWRDWKSDPRTKEFMNACKERIKDATDLLITRAGIDSVQDNFYRGFILAYQEIEDFKVEDTTEYDQTDFA